MKVNSDGKGARELISCSFIFYGTSMRLTAKDRYIRCIFREKLQIFSMYNIVIIKQKLISIAPILFFCSYSINYCSNII